MKLFVLVAALLLASASSFSPAPVAKFYKTKLDGTATDSVHAAVAVEDPR